MILGIDVGGTHTDSVLVEGRRIRAKAKVPTDRADILGCVLASTRAVADAAALQRLDRIAISTTLLTNAVVENRLAPARLVVMTGPGVAPSDLPFADRTTLISGVIDHRGVEVMPPDAAELAGLAGRIAGAGPVAIVGKFSSRNAAHERRVAAAVAGAEHVTLGHRLSGQLNFPRRIATSYLNAAAWPVHARFVDALAGYLAELGVAVPIHILKADGGTLALTRSRETPVETVLSGPAATIMGVLPLMPKTGESISIDIGGTTTDIALFADGAPLMQPQGVEIAGHRTLVRGLLTRSIGLGGDSRVIVVDGRLVIGPERDGPAMAFGGPTPTPTDAMVVLGRLTSGDADRAHAAMAALGAALGQTAHVVAGAILEAASARIAAAVSALVADVNAQPVYTIHEMLAGGRFRPERLVVVGGPAPGLATDVGAKLGMAVDVPADFDVANALGAALARTTAELTLVADTESGMMSIAETGEQVAISSRFSLDDVVAAGRDRLVALARAAGARDDDLAVEVTERQSFNVVRGFSTTGRNMRVRLQIKPGLSVAAAGEGDHA